MKKIAPVIVAVIIIGLISFIILRTRPTKEDGVIVLSGNVEVTETDCGFKVPGRIEGLLSEEGDRVVKGSRVAVLDSAELRDQVLQAKAVWHEAKARLDDLRVGSRPQELRQAGSSVSAAAADLTKASRDFERAEMLYKNGAIPAQQLDAARRAKEVAEAQRGKAAEALSLAEEGARKKEIAASQSRVGQAEAGMKIADERLKEADLLAPLSGVVLRKNREAGEVVTAGAPVYTIGDLAHPWIRVYVKEEQLGMVKLGQKAEVTVDSHPGKIYPGRVTFISSEAEFTPKNIQTREERVKLVFGVKVSVQNVEDELKPGMPADVRIMLR
ncbi:MAG: efflux RND transporter periplasmic adaptor subunit [Nitrospiraceae bacterium]|nr:efflux RND transporter periplasmic adaptor subunit [Nitrospiraceae bacterium]